jgi:HEPN domain-containing protein
VNRVELQHLAEERALDALALFSLGRWSGSYYLSGYSVECALKACIARMTALHDYPDKNFAEKCYTHEISALIRLANRETDLEQRMKQDSTFRVYWMHVKDWTVDSRYQDATEFRAGKLLRAVTDETHGVLPWIRGLW